MPHPSSKNIIGIYQRHAHAFDALRQDAFVEQAWLDAFIALLQPGAKVLDMGCGSGKPVASYLIEQGLGITGIDTSGPLIDICRERFPSQQWLINDMRNFHCDMTFDGVIAWDSFFHLIRDDQRNMFSQFARHTAHGAPLMFTSGPADGEAIGQFQDEPLYHSSLSSQEYRRLLTENGFTVVRTVTNDPACGGRTIWLAQSR